MRDIIFRGRTIDGTEWVHGWYTEGCCGAWPLRPCIIARDKARGGCWELVEVDPETVGEYTGLEDKNGVKIFEGDITRLVLESGEIRHFEVCFGTMRRELVKPLTGYDAETNPVQITGVFFDWNEDWLLPNVDDDYVSDVKRMEVIGNIYDNPLLLEEHYFA